MNQARFLLEIDAVDEELVYCSLYREDSNYENVDELVTFASGKIEYHKPLLPGMVFWWDIDGDAGTSVFTPHEMMSHVWTKEQIEKINKEAEILMEQMNKYEDDKKSNDCS